MDLLLSFLPQILLGNAIGDVFLALDPTGTAEALFSNGPMKTLVSQNEPLIVRGFIQSFLIHAIVRITASRNLNNREVRLLAIASYVSEMFCAWHLYRAGAIALPHGLVFALPVGVIVLLAHYQGDKKKD